MPSYNEENSRRTDQQRNDDECQDKPDTGVDAVFAAETESFVVAFQALLK